MSKNVTFRFNESDLEKYDNFAKKIGVNRTTLVRNAIDKYIYSHDGLEKEPSVLETSKSLLGITPEIRAAEKHELYVLIKKEGLKVNDDNGNVIATITDLTSLFDFVNTKVLQR